MATFEQYWDRCLQRTDIELHLPRLYAEAEGIVLELGVRYGNSTAALLAGVERRGKHLYSVDINDCSGVIETSNHWTFIQADSLDYEKIYPHVQGAIDILFIDTDHTYERTKAELELWGNITKRRIFLHDTDSHHGVRKAMIEYCLERNLMFWLIQGSNGLGIIQC